MTLDSIPATLRAIDDDLLASLESGDERYVTEIRHEHGRPRVEIEVISDPHLDVPDEERALAPGLAVAFGDRWEKLREPFGEDPPDLLVIRGTSTLQPAPNAAELDAGAATAVWETAFERLEDRGQRVLRVPENDPAATGEVAAVFAAKPARGDPQSQLALTVLAVVGVPAAAEGAAEADGTGGLERLVATLVASTARNAPLHVIAVSGRARASRALMARCQRLRIGLVLAAADNDDDVVTLSRTAMHQGQGASDTTLVPCPGFKSGTGSPGLTRVSVDAVKGEAAIAFRHDLGSDRAPNPVQVVRPLPSASRVSSSERRLYARVRQLLQPALDGAPSYEQAPRLHDFDRHVERIWTHTGYAALCGYDGTVPLEQTRYTTYNLLLLLRERAGGYDMLLSNHSPMRPSALSDWNTLLLPAFKDVRQLLEHLRDDVVRQVTERAEDYERAAHAEAFERAVNRILTDDGQFGNDLWADDLREVATRKIRKISPTTGAVTEFTYHLLTLLPLVDRSLAKPVEPDVEAGREAPRRNDRHRIIEWLKGLDTVRVPSADPDAGRGLPLEALWDDGAGLRWDPESMLGDLQADAAKRRRRVQAHPGAIWFPLAGPQEPALWRQCPAIVARNADVMSWVESELAGRRREDESFPEQLVLGRYSGDSDEYRVELEYPFEGPCAGLSPEDEIEEREVPARSTAEALSLVRLNSDYDLGEERAYDGARFERVWLVRDATPAGRDAIHVYPAEAGEREFDAETAGRAPLGLLRPVQRYVLRAGIERVQALGVALREQLGEDRDPWGFVRVRKGGAPSRVSVTPPIVEQLHREDWSDPALGNEFVVCDGNHRVVREVWRERGSALAAVAIVGELRRPYYARPFGALEWEATSDNELVVAPDVAWKYLTRSVDDPELLERFRGREKLLYRRYFRDLETGFGPIGGQGGRFA
jgi:hypothetical protein